MDHSPPAPRPPFPWRDALLALALFGVVFALFVNSPIRTMGDSKYTLLLTDTLLTRGSFVLDGRYLPHKEPVAVGDAYLDGDTYQIEIVHGQYYYYLPPGSSILSAPFVLVAKAFGHNVFGDEGSYSEDRESGIQLVIASLLMAVLTVIFYLTARWLLPAGWSAVVALGGALGTQVWSTASRALWTHTWGSALLGTALYLLLARETGRRRLPPVALATLLSWAYFVRPTNSVFIVGITVYLWLRHRGLFLRYAATGAAWFAAFAVYSWAHFGKLLPSYYQAKRLATSTFWEALTGNLVSPSRGVLVFVPVALFVFYLVARYWRHLPHRPLVWLTAAVSAGHLAAVSSFMPWYGGWCYGPRYTAELVPWFVLLAVLGTRAALARHQDADAPPPGALAWRATLAAGGGLLILSVLIQWRGANVPATAGWNERPVSVDVAPDRVWDWRHPQMLAGLVKSPLPAHFPVLDERRVRFGNGGAGRAFEWEGWSDPDTDACWTEQPTATLVFTAHDLTANRLRMAFAPYLEGPKLRRQWVSIRLNDHLLAVFPIRRSDPREYVFTLPPGTLERRNVLTFTLPDAAAPSSVTRSADTRPLGIALRWMELKGPSSPPASVDIRPLSSFQKLPPSRQGKNRL